MYMSEVDKLAFLISSIQKYGSSLYPKAIKVGVKGEHEAKLLIRVPRWPKVLLSQKDS